MRNRFIITTVITFAALLFSQNALAAGKVSTHSSDMEHKQCYVVEGDLVEWNGWPPLTRLVSKGHKHVYVFDEDCPQSKAFQEMQATKDGSLNGKFEVCPTGKSFYAPDEFKPLERACLGSGSNLTSLPPISVYYKEGHGPHLKPLIPAAKKVMEAYTMMKNHPGNSLYEVKFLRAFPHDYQTFENVYYQDDHSQLYDESEEQVYIAMKELRKKHPKLVGIDLIAIGKQVKYDFPNYDESIETLVQMILEYETVNTRVFIQLFNQLSEIEKKNLTFLVSSMEYIDPLINSGQFKVFIKNLDSSGARNIADQFQQQFKQAEIKYRKWNEERGQWGGNKCVKHTDSQSQSTSPN